MATYDIIKIADYLSVMVKGALTVTDFMRLTDDVLAECKDQDVHKVIVDVTDTAGSFTNADKIEFAKYASEKLSGVVEKYAYVYPHELLDYSSQFVAQGRGLNVRAYYEIEQAINWMEKK